MSSTYLHVHVFITLMYMYINTPHNCIVHLHVQTYSTHIHIYALDNNIIIICIVDIMMSL